ncbi:unnamed protein product, partial [Phaeothamnion confervicola]
LGSLCAQVGARLESWLSFTDSTAFTLSCGARNGLWGTASWAANITETRGLAAAALAAYVESKPFKHDVETLISKAFEDDTPMKLRRFDALRRRVVAEKND